MPKENRSFLGTGWSFPPTFTSTASGVEMNSGKEDIEDSLYILLTTRLQERVMRLDYGCNLDSLLFEGMSSNLQTRITDMIQSAILLHEPRIDLENILLELDQELEGVLLIELIYSIRTTNSRSNFVFPFYLNEGTNLTR